MFACLPLGCYPVPEGVAIGPLVGSGLLTPKKRALTGADVVREARSWIGTKYRHQGRSRAGVDCIGLPVVVREGLGLLTPPVALDYAPVPIDEAMLAYCRQHICEIARADLAPGDVIVFDCTGMRHMGIVGDYVHGGLSLIHAYAKSPRRVAENAMSDAWLRSEKLRVMACFRFPEIA